MDRFRGTATFAKRNVSARPNPLIKTSSSINTILDSFQQSNKQTKSRTRTQTNALFVCLLVYLPPATLVPPPQTPPSPIIKGVSPLKRFLPVACALSCMPIPNSLSACRKRERRERRTKGEIAERKKGRREKKGGREKGKGRNVEGVSVTTMRQRLPTRARARTALKRGKGEKMRKKKTSTGLGGRVQGSLITT